MIGTVRWTRGLRRAAVGLATLGSASAAAPVSAQIAPRTQSIDFDANLIYDSNVTGSSTALATSRGLTPSDEIFEPSVRFNIARPLGRETVFLQGSAGYDFHLKNSILNTAVVDLHPGLQARLARCQTTLNGAFTRAQSSLAETALTPAGLPSFVTARNVLTSENVAFSAECGRAIGLAPTASVSETWSQNSDPLQQFVDARTFSASAGLAYRRPTFGTLTLFGAYSKTDYPHPLPALGLGPSLGLFGVSRNYETMSGGVTYARSIGARLQGSATLSYTDLKPASSIGGFAGLTYAASLNYRATSRLNASIVVSRATVPAVRINSSYGIDEVYSAQAAYRASRRLTVSAGASYGHNHYNGVPYPLGSDLTDERVYTAFGNAEFMLTRRLSLGLNVLHKQEDANFPGLSYPETRAALSTRLAF